jgi:phospholipid/cholesterol/gamma-HCH transport system ATP-binding protein
MTETTTPLIELRRIRKTFGKKNIHDGVDLTLYHGELLALFGGSGTGKSLILRSIIGLETPDEGEILWRGKSISGLSEDDWIEVRKKIAYVFQNGALFDSLTVYENLAYPLREHTKMTEGEISEKISEMLATVDMPGTENLLPSELSGGMQKRAGLARAMILKPEILLFDEPTAGLDPTNTKRFVQNILDLKRKGLTGIFVTHDIGSALAVADRIAILHDRRIYCVEPVEQFKSSQDSVIRSFLFPEEKP